MGSTAPRSPHVLIIGAGIGGLFLAQFLRKQGVPFSIFERDASPDARFPGWAIGLNMLDDFASFMPDDVPPLRDANHLLPLDLPSQFIMYPPGGARIGVEDSPKTPCVRVNRKRLRELLLTGVPVQWGKKVVSIDEKEGTVTAVFEDGTSATGDLLVGADGTWSKTREHVLGRSNTETLEPLPMAMISGEVTIPNDGTDDGVLGQQLRLGHSSYIAIRPGTTFFCGVDRMTPSGDAASFYWFLYMRDDTAAAADNWLRTATKEEKYKHVMSFVEEKGLEPRHTEIVRRGSPTDVTEAFSLYYDAILESFPTQGRHIVLIGDAAHPTTPFRGEGGIMAIKDALQLSNLLGKAAEKGVDEATLQGQLEAFQDEVAKRGAAVVQMSRNAILGTGGPANPANNQKPRSWGFEVRPIPESTGPLGLGKVETK
ncbi:hypothetical protein SEUCBS139899_000687 [Sporothrix eucalyptigena]|uniref:FAD-binding domain-containing protein n=1 Tax=Sporothrix eucalyptigena TaxID=1812306 RepID=A0ABP0AUK1_9PEZI